MPAPKGNTYGAKPAAIRAGGQLQLRVNEMDKKNWKAAAKRHGFGSVAQWVIATLNKRAEK